MKSSLEVGSILHQPLFCFCVASMCQIGWFQMLTTRGNMEFVCYTDQSLWYKKKRGYHCFDTPSSMCMYTIKVFFAYFLASSMTPSMYNRVISGSPLVRTVMVFLKCPGNLPLPLYVTFISPFFPG